MTFDPLRCAEATCQAAVVLGATLLPAAWRALDPGLAAVLATLFVIVSAGIYALHAVTFDSLRLTGRRLFPTRPQNE
ncbi:hypothetical protein OWR29_41310 [Actinoplanes sp. Pm04-4]|jgi:hypothetical protein|uniref:Chlorhexidine efflux transporter domain-containing protein n=1 Tax=Paractinoplanes pyxinae TaxID=2997416 RepID=A0ABT4BFA3_9ACTN|nr:hypothetical protein [Actinoplanes pyxinae]MCY1144475.1 hypothetical protein [Actinoplanes pyxinae]